MMKKENDELTELFRTKLGDATLTPRDGFWDSIQNDISLIERRRRKLLLYRSVAAASILLVIGVASAMFLLPKSESKTEQITAKANALTPLQTTPSNHKIEIEPNIPVKAAVAQTASTATVTKGQSGITSTDNQLAAMTKQTKLASNNVEADDDSTVTVTVHMTVRVKDNNEYADNSNSNNNNVWQAGGFNQQTNENNNQSEKLLADKDTEKNNSWMLKAALGLTTPTKTGYDTPLNGSITIEKKLNNWLALESGIKYTYMHSTSQTLHYLSVPVKANVTIAKTKDVELYATAGGSADKCIAASHDWANEKIQFTAMAGAGIRYKLNNKLSLFVEPTLTHYFNNDSKYQSYRTEKKNAFNLQGGLCMNF